MTSAILARFRGASDQSAASIYETIRQHDEEASLARSDDSFSDTRPLFNTHQASGDQGTRNHAGGSRAEQGPLYHGEYTVDDIEDDVPASLLIEDSEQAAVRLLQGMHNRGTRRAVDAISVDESRWVERYPRPSSIDEEQPPHQANARASRLQMNAVASTSPRELALWRWANVENLDNFLYDVYDYYLMRGYWSIILHRILNLLSAGFVIIFSLILSQCINWTLIKDSTKLSEVLVHKCTARMGLLPNAVLWLTTFFGIIKVAQYVFDLRRLQRLHDFYLYLLNVPEAEIQSISWQEIVSRLMALRDANPTIRTGPHGKTTRYMGTQSKQRMDAHDIANRLMRMENYMIAMINKDILDTTLPLPLLGRRQFLTKTLEWHLNYCIQDYVFDEKGQVKQLFLKDTHRKALSEGLRRRFIFAGSTSLFLAPFLIVFYLIQNFFQHFNEYQKNPAQIGFRQYSTHAQWKFREFNELQHLFEKRLKMSYPFALRYINQFPKDKTVQVARFVTLISGAVVSVLGLATVLEQENFLSFEISHGRTTIFYLGVFGSIWAVARGLLPADNMVHDSSYSMEEVVEYTHYLPSHWVGRLHTVEVKTEFASLYQTQIVVLLEEALSIVFTPFVLWWALPACSDRVIDFFREFTVHVDGLGYVCSFAEFNLKKPGQIGSGDNAGTRAAITDHAAAALEDYYGARDNKLEQSYWNFMNDYAQNPKTDVHFPHRSSGRRRTNMPPPFPGLLSPTRANRPIPEATSAAPRIQTASGGESAQASAADAKHPLNRSISAQSMLLDAQHQPMNNRSVHMSPQSSRPRRMNGRSRILPSKGVLMSSVLKEEDEVSDEVEVARPRVGEHTSNSKDGLGSWKYDEELEAGEEEESAADELGKITEGGGVLELIRHFQKAHDIDKRAGV